MYNPKFARKKVDGIDLYDRSSKVPAGSVAEETVDQQSDHNPEEDDSEPNEYIDIGKRRLEETFNIDDPVLRPSLLTEEDREYSFSQYLKKPSTSGIGITNRVSRILRNASRIEDVESAIVETNERKQWRQRKQQLVEEIGNLKAEIRRFEVLGPASDSSRGLPPRLHFDDKEDENSLIPKGVLTELAILRRENFALRNLTDADIEVRSREIIENLRQQVEGLEEQNANLHRLINQNRDNHLVYTKPPNDIADLNNLKRVPLEIDNLEKERVMQVLEDEWKYASSISRHGSSEPLRNPFERRRFINN